MATRWMAGALLALCGMGTPMARAQYLPVAPGPKPFAEPIPVGPSQAPAPSFVPGPMPSWLAPRGPKSDLELPCDLPGAFPPDDECINEYCGFYIGGGGIGLDRSGLGNTTLAIADRRSIPRFNSPEALNVSGLTTDLTWGFKMTAGYAWGGGALEVSGFYLSPLTAAVSTSDPSAGRQLGPDYPALLASFFTNWPVGFEGNNGLWTQAAMMQAQYKSHFGGIEGNYRTWSPIICGCEGICGIRYLGLQEQFDFVTNDWVRVPIPIQDFTAAYQLQTHNNIIAPQIGFECTKDLLPCLSLGFGFKGALGADFWRAQAQLVRGDGLVGVNQKRQGTCFTQVYEGNVFIDFCCWANSHIRANYNFLGVIGVPEVMDQINFNLATQLTNVKTNGSIFYHGPMIELYILF